MKTDRNMYYQNPAFQTMPGAPVGFPGAGFPQMGIPSNIEGRLDTLERQVRRLDARVTRLETPYTGGQFTTQPYSTSVPNQDFSTLNYQNTMHMM